MAAKKPGHEKRSSRIMSRRPGYEAELDLVKRYSRRGLPGMSTGHSNPRSGGGAKGASSRYGRARPQSVFTRPASSMTRTQTYHGMPGMPGNGYTSNGFNPYGNPNPQSSMMHSQTSMRNVNGSNKLGTGMMGLGGGGSGMSSRPPSEAGSDAGSLQGGMGGMSSSSLASSQGSFGSSSGRSRGMSGSTQPSHQMSVGRMRIERERLAELKKEIIDSKKLNEKFGLKSLAEEWTCLEVAHWLQSIHLEKYMQTFMSQSVDGSILLNDLDVNMLVTELHIKQLHLKKVIREIQKLQDAKRGLTTDDKDKIIAELKSQNDSLINENRELKKIIENNASKQTSGEKSK